MATTTAAADDGPAIRARRESLGLTRPELAVAARCSLTWLANIEAGCLRRHSEVLGRINVALDAAEHQRHQDPSNEQRPGDHQGAAKVVRGDRDAGYQHA